MSEYQYYEFQAIDRPLTDAEQQAVAQLSSRVHPHPRRAVFTYHWSDFPARAEEILAECYDAMLYLANWGSRRLMFRFPKSLVDVEHMFGYNVVTLDYPSDVVNAYTQGEYAILDIRLDEEEGLDWIEGEGWLDSLIGLREAILRRDDRLLYLAWLKGLELAYDLDEDALEPPLPAGLDNLTAALDSFAELFDLDQELLQVAVEHTAEKTPAPSTDDLRQAIAQLPPDEKDAYLWRLAQSEPHLSLALHRRLAAFLPASQPEAVTRRTVGQVLTAWEDLQEHQRREHAAAAQAKRVAILEALAGQEEKTWDEVEFLIQQSQAKPYDQAVSLLLQLKDLAEYQNREAAFEDHLASLCDRYKRRYALMGRLREAGLIEAQ